MSSSAHAAENAASEWAGAAATAAVLNVSDWDRLFHWALVPAADGAEGRLEPTFKGILAFAIYYRLRKEGIRWTRAIATGSSLLRQTDSEEDFGEYELLPQLPPTQAPATGVRSLLNRISNVFRGDPTAPPPEQTLSKQFHLLLRVENPNANAASSTAATAPAIGSGIAVIERPHGRYNHLVFHVVRAMLEYYEQCFRRQHPQLDMVNDTRIEPHQLHDLLRNTMAQLMEGQVTFGRIVGMLVFAGAFAVQCYEREMFRTLDDLFDYTNEIFQELVGPWLQHNENWVPSRVDFSCVHCSLCSREFTNVNCTVVQTGFVRHYLTKPLLADELLPTPAPGLAQALTPTFDVLNIARMPLAYQTEHLNERRNEGSPNDESPQGAGAEAPLRRRRFDEVL